MEYHTALFTGLALIELTNLIALAGVWYNREDASNSTLLLSERELQPYTAWPWQENSGLTLRLNWRLPNTTTGTKMLDSATLLDLGFVPPTSKNPRHLARQAEPQRKRQRRKQARDALAASPKDKRRQEADRATKNRLEYEEHRASRLFVVDVRPSPEALRARYPDSNRYALARGIVNAWIQDGKLTGQAMNCYARSTCPKLGGVPCPSGWFRPIPGKCCNCGPISANG